MESNTTESPLDRMSVAPPDPNPAEPPARVGAADAGTDTSIAERLARNPESRDARLDRALDESMDASDPPASTQPIHNHAVPESSGYNAAAERKLAAGDKGFVGKVLSKLGLG